MHPNQVAYNIYVTASPYFGKNEATDSWVATRVLPWLDATNDCRLIELPLLFESALKRGRKERSLFEEIIFGFCCRRRLLLLEDVARKGIASKRYF